MNAKCIHLYANADVLPQRGFLLGPFLPYIVGLVAIMAILTGTYLKGRSAGVESAEARLQPLLSACEGRERALGTQIEAQNAAVRALEASGKAKQAAARVGMEQARKAAQSARSEAARLREAAKTTPVGQCPAGEAVKVLRDGLK